MPPRFRTINGLCALVIRYYARQKGTEPFALADDEGRLNAVVRELLSKGGGGYPSDQQVKEACTHITYCKNMMLSDAEVETHKVDGMDFPAVYHGYQNFLMKNRLMDFDDQMVFTCRVFRQFPEVLAHFQRRWPYLCVDAAQGTSKIQHVILRQLAANSRNIAKFQGPRISPSEGLECVENTGFAGKIAFSPHELGSMW